ncbi:hypothetical protein ASPCAL06190 [Aspergillus calidoustus]|uniref:Uncharacterized protein n=1 Tax=Aspergillus calidoustus TaxID=454130 RepID=A0A0U5G2D8_ASPCI|nr:hypothetical protein ASPCAL06190 [Aspergillus calidoustus]
MADVRSLLRNELASRRGTSQTGSTPNRVTKKRKVDPTESATRKKVRHTDPEQLLANAQILPPSAQIVAEAEEEEDDVEALPQDVMSTDNTPTQLDIVEETVETTTQVLETTSIPPAEAPAVPQAVDEDEWAAFEREVAAPTRVPPQKPAALAAAATISAAPITTEELAALQQKENEEMRRNREAEAEGEREDAARFLEEEFDEMEQLEERVRRLKQMREQLRMKRATDSAEPIQVDEAAAPPEQAAKAALNGDKSEDEEDDDDDDDDDDWDNWRFR